MAITIIPTYDSCERPNCPGDPTPEFVSYPLTSSHLITIPVVWRILNNNIPSSTEIRYSLNDQRLNQRITSSTRGDAYTDGDLLYSDIPIQFKTGTLYMQAQAIINGNIYFSEVATITIASGEANCFPEWQVDDSTDVYIEYTTYSVPDQIQVLGNYNKDTCEGNILYDTGCVSSKFYSKTPDAYPPTQFNPNVKKYSGTGLYINRLNVWHDCFTIHTSDFPLGVKVIPNCENTSGTAYIVKVLGPDFDLYRDASTKGMDADCVEVKEKTATVHYQTYHIRDSIVIYSGEAPDPCLDPRDTDGLLWESGCVGTSRGEGPGLSGGNYGATGKFDTFKYTEDDVPFTVSVFPGCDPPGTGTKWCATVYYSDGTVAWSDCGDNVAVCSIEEDPSIGTDPVVGGQWIEVAPQLGIATNIFAIVVFNNKLYGGTYTNGSLYEWNDVNAWVEVAPQLGTEDAIHSLLEFNGKLYGSTGSNGKLYEWNDVNAWVEVAPQLGSETIIRAIVVFNSKLYGGTYVNGKLYEWNDVNAWVEVAPQLVSGAVYSLAVFNNKLYGGVGGKLYEWNDVNAWVEVAPQLGSETIIFSLAVFNGKLYGGTHPNGKLYEWNDVNAWVEVAPQLGASSQIRDLAVFNNKLYGGTASTGKLYEWNDVDAWVEVAPDFGSAQAIYSLVEFNSKLYGSTGFNGKLLQWDTDA